MNFLRSFLKSGPGEKMTHEKIRVHAEITTLSHSDSLESLCEQIQSILDEKQKGVWTDIDIQLDPYEDMGTWFVSGYRIETDKEFKQRMKVLEAKKKFDEKYKAEKEAKEREQYEKLKAKYG